MAAVRRVPLVHDILATCSSVLTDFICALKKRCCAFQLYHL